MVMWGDGFPAVYLNEKVDEINPQCVMSGRHAN